MCCCFRCYCNYCKKRTLIRKKLNRQKRSVWVRPWLNRKNELRVDSTPLQELRLDEGDEYQRFFGMFCKNIDELLQLVDFDTKKSTPRLQHKAARGNTSKDEIFSKACLFCTSIAMQRRPCVPKTAFLSPHIYKLFVFFYSLTLCSRLLEF